MDDPLSLWKFYLRNKRRVFPLIAILALAMVGVVVEDSLLASARETAYATFGSYKKLILVAPRPTREEDLANPLRESRVRLDEVRARVDALDGPTGLPAYYQALAAVPAQVRAQLPLLGQFQHDADAARYYAARLRGDLQPLSQLIVRMQRLQAEEQAFTQLEQQLRQNPNDPTPLISYLQQHRTVLSSVLPDSAELGRLQQTMASASADAQGLQYSLSQMTYDAARLDAAGRQLLDLPPPPAPDQALAPFRAALDRLGQSIAPFDIPQADLEQLHAAAAQLPGTMFALRDAYSNLDINLLAGNAQFDLYGLDEAGMNRLLTLYGDRLKAGRLPNPNASEVVLSEEIARARQLGLGGKVGNDIDELDRLPDVFHVVGIVEGPTRLGLIPYDYMTVHYLFERRYQGLVVAPEPGKEEQVREGLERLIAGRPFRLFDWAYIKGKIDSLIANLDTINRLLVLLVIVVLSLVVGLLNYLSFRQRMNEFGLLAAIGYGRLSLLRRVAWESVGVTVIAWVLGVGLALGVLWWFNQTFMVPHGLLLEVFDWGLIVTHTLPILLMAFACGLATVAWQLLRMDPILIIERRD